MRIPALLVATALLCGQAGSALAAPDQFDLVCTGSIQAGTKPAEPWSSRYRVDLRAGRWCFDTCPKVNGIFRADAGEIVLTNRDDRPSGSWVELHTVQRSTGDMVQRIASLDLYIKATCEPAAFTAIPDTKF